LTLFLKQGKQHYCDKVCNKQGTRTLCLLLPACSPAAAPDKNDKDKHMAGQIIHPGWLRLTHWLNVVAVFILIASGWRIYDAAPVFKFRIPPDITLGGWLGGALQWHFFAMWLLLANGILYLTLNLVTGRLLHKYFPISPREIFNDFFAALKGKLVHADPAHYNSLQKLAYLFVMGVSILVVISGLVMWKSVQFPHLRALMGNYDDARIVHFLCMAGLVGFIAVHLAMVALVPRTFITMIRGR
jgi:thiosulfate reductase cytochrome b subunit